MNSKYKKPYKINEKNNTNGSNTFTDYFSKMREKAENEITSLNKISQIFQLPNNSSQYITVDNSIQKITSHTHRKKNKYFI